MSSATSATILRRADAADRSACFRIYNQVAADLPAFHALCEHINDPLVPESDPAPMLCLLAESAGSVVGFITLQDCGRISCPWVLPGFECLRQILIEELMRFARAKRQSRIFVAVRWDWNFGDFFEGIGFRRQHQIITFTQNLNELPTLLSRRGPVILQIQESDLPEVIRMGQGILQTGSNPRQLNAALRQHPGFAEECVVVVRRGGTMLGMGVWIDHPHGVSAEQLDGNHPIYLQGSIGSEGLPTLPVAGLFSFLSALPLESIPMGLDLLADSIKKIQRENLQAIAAQVPSDAAHLLSFYNRYFQEVGRFPVWEKRL